MIEFSEHAKERNLKRKIPKKWIIQTVKEPEEILDSVRKRKINRRKFRNKILEVVTITEDQKTTVITQYYLGEEYES